MAEIEGAHCKIFTVEHIMAVVLWIAGGKVVSDRIGEDVTL